MSVSLSLKPAPKPRSAPRRRPRRVPQPDYPQPQPRPAERLAAAWQEGRRVEVEAVRAYLGALWPVIFNVLIKRIDPELWATAIGMDVRNVCGYLASAQDKLAAFYANEAKRGTVQPVLGLN